MSQTKDFKFSDILPLSLGTEIVGGISSIIIPRNTLLPATQTKDYTTVYYDQTSILFKLLEGERMMGRDNNLLGDMKLNGLQRGHPAVDVTFTIDANGSLHTKAVERLTGRSCEAKVQYSQKRLGQLELDRMIAEAERLRLDDQKKVDDAKARNELESFCLDLQSKVEMNRNMSAVAEKCRDVLEWLKEGSRIKVECEAKKQELEALYRRNM